MLRRTARTKRLDQRDEIARNESHGFTRPRRDVSTSRDREHIPAFGLTFLKGFFLFARWTIRYVLQFDKLLDSLCEDKSWIDGKLWQRFYQKFTFVLISIF